MSLAMTAALTASLFPLIVGIKPDPYLPAAKIQEWVQAYAPIVVHDSREIAPLTSPEASLALAPELQGSCADGSRRRLVVDKPDFMSRADVQSLIQDCPGELALHYGGKIPKPEAISYYSVVADGLYVKIQYWLYYAWNDTSLLGGAGLVQQCGNHEGDWEHIAIRIDRRELEAAGQDPVKLRAAIDDIYLAQHNRSQFTERKYFRPNDARLTFSGSQLTIYPGVGSHATYHAAGRFPLMTIAGMAMADYNDGKGLRLDLAKGRLEPIVNQPWFEFGGRWGAVSHDACDPIERMTAASNDGSYGPGHAHKVKDLYEGDWHDSTRLMLARP